MKKATVDLFTRIFSVLAPPPNMTVSQWADKYRRLSSESSAEPGRWRTSKAPYQREIMDAVCDMRVQKVVIMSAAQIGKTDALILNPIGYYMHYDPSPIMVMQPTTWIMEDRYNPDGAEKRYRENLAAKGAPLKIGNDHELADYLERKVIEEDRSPAAALADITIEGRTFKTSICVSTFYGYIEKGVFLNLTNKDLPEKPKRKRPYHKVKTTKRAPRGESIEKRPEVINQRITFGHWEMDTVYSGKDGSCALLVLTERLSRKEIIEKMRDRTAISTVRALNRIERRFGALFPRVFQTITVDNGGEFSDVKSLERSILRKGRRTKMYYCHPYTSCERGSNECANKMIRRKFPKGTDFNKVSRAEVKKAEEWMNNYPREILGWKTAEIVFAECLEELAREA